MGRKDKFNKIVLLKLYHAKHKKHKYMR